MKITFEGKEYTPVEGVHLRGIREESEQYFALVLDDDNKPYRACWLITNQKINKIEELCELCDWDNIHDITPLNQ